MHARKLPLVAVLFLTLLPIIGGCTDDESDTPMDTGGIELPTDVELVTRLADRMVSQLREISWPCRAAHLIDPGANEDAFDHATDEILRLIFEGADVSSFHGTWADTSASTSDGTGVVRIDANDPPDAIRLQVVGTDSLGLPISGDMTLTIDRRRPRVQSISADIELTVRESESEDTISITGSVTASGDITGDLTEMVATIDITGTACDHSFALELETDPNMGIEASGFYLVDTIVSFDIDANTTPADSSLTVRVWMGGEGNPQILWTVSEDSPQECLGGEVFVFGEKQGDVITRYCDTDSATVFVAFEEDTLALEDLFSDFVDLLEDFGIDP